MCFVTGLYEMTAFYPRLLKISLIIKETNRVITFFVIYMMRET